MTGRLSSNVETHKQGKDKVGLTTNLSVTGKHTANNPMYPRTGIIKTDSKILKVTATAVLHKARLHLTQAYHNEWWYPCTVASESRTGRQGLEEALPTSIIHCAATKPTTGAK